MDGYPIAAEALDLEVYVLAAVFAGSAALAGLEARHRGLRWVRGTFERPEASRRLISLAVMVRSQLDVLSRSCDMTVGTYVRDVRDQSEQEPLTLREACNKIIHAESVELSPGKWEHSESPALSTAIVLEGTFQRCEWRADLDVVAFLDAACTELRPAQQTPGADGLRA